MSFQERQVEIADGARLLLRDSGGDGPAVLLCHPHTGNARSWSAQEHSLAKAGLRVLAYSRRYHAGSDPGTGTGSYGGDALALIDALGVNRCAVVGVAAGGGVVLDLMLCAPERMTWGVVSSSVMGLADPVLADRIAALRPDGFDALPPEVQELGATFRYANPAGVAEWKALKAQNQLLGRQGFSVRPTPGALASVAVPLLMMTGSADLFLPPVALADAAQAIPGAIVQIIPDAGHAPHIETPDAFNAAILRFAGDMV